MVLGVAAFAVMAALSLTSAGATSAKAVRSASHISIRSHGLRFSGRVTSPSVGCLSERSVTLYRTNGDVLGSTRTDQRGHWHIQAQGSAGITMGQFYAKVHQLTRESHNPRLHTSFVCEPAMSKAVPSRPDHRADAAQG